MKPTTPLPWSVEKGDKIWSESDRSYPARAQYAHQDAAYIAHTANAYPKLVEELKVLLDKYERIEARLNEKSGYTAQFHSSAALEVRRLLRELREIE